MHMYRHDDPALLLVQTESLVLLVLRSFHAHALSSLAALSQSLESCSHDKRHESEVHATEVKACDKSTAFRATAAQTRASLTLQTKVSSSPHTGVEW